MAKEWSFVGGVFVLFCLVGCFVFVFVFVFCFFSWQPYSYCSAPMNLQKGSNSDV